jgi:hypothetical protein
VAVVATNLVVGPTSLSLGAHKRWPAWRDAVGHLAPAFRVWRPAPPLLKRCHLFSRVAGVVPVRPILPRLRAGLLLQVIKNNSNSAYRPTFIHSDPSGRQVWVSSAGDPGGMPV